MKAKTKAKLQRKPNAAQDAANDIDRVAEIEQLAALDPIDYEAARVPAAMRLKVRASVLDREVTKKRRALGLDTDNNDDGQGRAVKIVDPLPWHEPIDGDRLATTLAAAIKTYVVLSDAAADTIALWVLHTWTVHAFTVTPRLAITSPTKGCGKTTVLRLLSHIARRAKRAGSISPSAMFRAVEKFQPTVLLDETEKYVAHGSDLHALMNEGHCKGASVWRIEGDKQRVLREFSVFGAMAFARNGRIPDDLEQRSIIIEMQRRRAHEELASLRDDRAESLQQIARMCARWADDNMPLLADLDPSMEMINRNADNWRPLFAIADVIGADWPDRIRDAAVVLTPRESESIGPMLLSDIRSLFDEKQTDRMASAELAEALAAIEGRPWAEWGKAKKPISKNQLAVLLKDFRIVSDNVRIGSRVPKGYHRHQFDEAFERYLAPLGPVGASEPLQRYTPTGAGTSGTFSDATPEICSVSERYINPDVAPEKHEKPLAHSACCDVAFQRPSEGVEGHEGAFPRCAQCGGEPDGEEQLQFVNGGQRVWLHPECKPHYVKDHPA